MSRSAVTGIYGKSIFNILRNHRAVFLHSCALTTASKAVAAKEFSRRVCCSFPSLYKWRGDRSRGQRELHFCMKLVVVCSVLQGGRHVRGVLGHKSFLQASTRRTTFVRFLRCLSLGWTVTVGEMCRQS